jgi:hypothetical protein
MSLRDYRFLNITNWVAVHLARSSLPSVSSLLCLDQIKGILFGAWARTCGLLPEPEMNMTGTANNRHNTGLNNKGIEQQA